VGGGELVQVLEEKRGALVGGFLGPPVGSGEVGSPTAATTSGGTATTVIGSEVARSRIEATPSPADCRVASSWRFLISSTDSAKGRYSTRPRSS
jgi:hypothetical protein